MAMRLACRVCKGEISLRSLRVHEDKERGGRVMSVQCLHCGALRRYEEPPEEPGAACPRGGSI
jgi:RNase P subunit RPR2